MNSMERHQKNLARLAELEAEDAAAIASKLHAAYEAAATKHGWITQEASRVAWNELPEPNRLTMIDAVEVLRNPAVLALIRGVIERHARFGIYDECGHDHVEGDGSVDCQDFRSCEHLYDLCAHCSVLDPDYPCAPDPDLETRWPCADYLAAENALGVGDE